MSARPPTCPLPREQVVDRYFLQHRAKLLDLAAFLDRVDRSRPTSADPQTSDDYRIVALRRTIAMLIDGKPHRARRILESLSDVTTEPVASAPAQAAAGAPCPQPPGPKPET